MKWPSTLTLIRHDISAYNILKKKKEKSSLYQKFLASFTKDVFSKATRKLAEQVRSEFALRIGDHNTPLDDDAGRATTMASRLKTKIECPDVVFVSPYERTQDTFTRMIKGWPELKDIPLYEEERIREQEHGLALLYNDWRVFHALHPEQAHLRKIEGVYWYRYPQGENVPDVRERNRSWLGTLVREFSEKKVLAITHHLNILATRANLERLNAEQFETVDEKEKPINCGVMIYRGHSKKGTNGKLVLEAYNEKLF